MIMTNHIVQSFDADLDQIESLVTQMGGCGLKPRSQTWSSRWLSRDAELGDRVRKGDRHVDELETAIDSAVVRVLALRPTAGTGPSRRRGGSQDLNEP